MRLAATACSPEETAKTAKIAKISPKMPILQSRVSKQVEIY